MAGNTGNNLHHQIHEENKTQKIKNFSCIFDNSEFPTLIDTLASTSNSSYVSSSNMHISYSDMLKTSNKQNGFEETNIQDKNKQEENNWKNHFCNELKNSQFQEKSFEDSKSTKQIVHSRTNNKNKTNLSNDYSKLINTSKFYNLANNSNRAISSFPSKKISFDNDLKIIKNEQNESQACTNDISLPKERKKRRKSKIKRQASLQTGKITVLSQEEHANIFKKCINKFTAPPYINNNDDFPELTKSLTLNKNRTKLSLEKSNSEENKFNSIVVCKKEILNTSNYHLLNLKDTKQGSSDLEKKIVEAKPLASVNSSITISFHDMLLTAKPKEKQSGEITKDTSLLLNRMKKNFSHMHTHNILASSPCKKRGKEREKPKAKRKSVLKKIILQERLMKKEKALFIVNSKIETENAKNEIDTDLMIKFKNMKIASYIPQENSEFHCKSMPENVESLSHSKAFLKPNDIINLDKPNPSPNNEELKWKNNVPGVSMPELSEKLKVQAAKVLLHTRTFREYCDHIPSKDIDRTAEFLLNDLVRFQDRMHQKDPIKARAKRRLIYGFKELKKHLKLGKLKCIIIATDIENIETEGGLNDILNEIKTSAYDYHVPCIFTLVRKKLGWICHKKVAVSCVGIFNYEGSEANYRKLMDLYIQSQKEYLELEEKLVKSLTIDDIKQILKVQQHFPQDLHKIRINTLKKYLHETNVIKIEDNK